MAIQKNTAISETIVNASGGYRFCILKRLQFPGDVRHFERLNDDDQLWGYQIRPRALHVICE